MLGPILAEIMSMSPGVNVRLGSHLLRTLLRQQKIQSAFELLHYWSM
jgi:hypothetical protein